MIKFVADCLKWLMTSKSLCQGKLKTFNHTIFKSFEYLEFLGFCLNLKKCLMAVRSFTSDLAYNRNNK